MSPAEANTANPTPPCYFTQMDLEEAKRRILATIRVGGDPARGPSLKKVAWALIWLYVAGCVGIETANLLVSVGLDYEWAAFLAAIGATILLLNIKEPPWR